MKQTLDPLSSLLPSHRIPYLEQLHMPYLGYHFLRETLTQQLLGNTEAPILFWLGKDIGSRLVLQHPGDLVSLFIRLGLGRLDLAEEKDSHLLFTLFHSVYTSLPDERLQIMLSLETGILAGAVSSWKGREVEAKLELYAEGEKETHKEARIVVTF